jgi:hypothetical protein
MEKGNEVLFHLELITKLMKGCNGVMEYNWRLGAVLHSMYCVLYADCLKSYCDCEQCRTIIKALFLFFNLCPPRYSSKGGVKHQSINH